MNTFKVYRNTHSCPEHSVSTRFEDGRWITQIFENGTVVVQAESTDKDGDLISYLEASRQYISLYKTLNKAA